jgi:hypothetical protein
MTQFALIQNHTVTNVIEADEATPAGAQYLASLTPPFTVVNLQASVQASQAPGLPVGIGWRYDPGANTFTPPVPSPRAPQPRRIAIGAFFDRFGPAKWAILSDANPAVQALIKDCSVRQFIDLDRTDLPQALGLLVQAGHAIDPQAIITAPIQAHEAP